jgi:hypothetical protein
MDLLEQKRQGAITLLIAKGLFKYDLSDLPNAKRAIDKFAFLLDVKEAKIDEGLKWLDDNGFSREQKLKILQNGGTFWTAANSRRNSGKNYWLGKFEGDDETVCELLANNSDAFNAWGETYDHHWDNLGKNKWNYSDKQIQTAIKNAFAVIYHTTETINAKLSVLDMIEAQAQECGLICADGLRDTMFLTKTSYLRQGAAKTYARWSFLLNETEALFERKIDLFEMLNNGFIERNYTGQYNWDRVQFETFDDYLMNKYRLEGVAVHKKKGKTTFEQDRAETEEWLRNKGLFTEDEICEILTNNTLLIFLSGERLDENYEIFASRAKSPEQLKYVLKNWKWVGRLSAESLKNKIKVLDVIETSGVHGLTEEIMFDKISYLFTPSAYVYARFLFLVEQGKTFRDGGASLLFLSDQTFAGVYRVDSKTLVEYYYPKDGILRVIDIAAAQKKIKADVIEFYCENGMTPKHSAMLYEKYGNIFEITKGTNTSKDKVAQVFSVFREAKIDRNVMFKAIMRDKRIILNTNGHAPWRMKCLLDIEKLSETQDLTHIFLRGSNFADLNAFPYMRAVHYKAKGKAITPNQIMDGHLFRKMTGLSNADLIKMYGGELPSYMNQLTYKKNNLQVFTQEPEAE